MYFSIQKIQEPQVKDYRSYINSCIASIDEFYEHKEINLDSDSWAIVNDVEFDHLSQEINNHFKPYNNELIMETRLLVSTKELEGLKLGTLALLRITNYSTICFINDNYKIKETNLLKVPKAEITVLKSETDIIQWLLDYAKGIAGGYAGKIATMILNQFVDWGESETQKLLRLINELVRDAIIEQTVRQNSAILKRVLYDIKSDYNPRSSIEEKNKLYEKLEKIKSDIVQVIFTMSDEMFREKGFFTFILGVNTLFMVRQEMTLKDPSEPLPEDSTDLKNIRSDAKQFSEQAQEHFDRMLKNRISMVRSIKTHRIPPDPPFSRGDSWYSFVDDFTSIEETSKDFDKIKSKREQVIRDIENKHNWVQETINAWKILIDNPLPKIV